MNNSLLVRLPMTNGETRFTMLETLREFAVERLTEQGEIERLRDWHASYYLGVAEAGEIGLRGTHQLAWLKRLARKRDNFQAAFEWSLAQARTGKKIRTLSHTGLRSTGETNKFAGCEMVLSGTDPKMEMLAIELCLRLTAALRPYSEWQGYLVEGRDRLKAALAILLEGGAEKGVLAARAKALSEMARLACLQNEQFQAVELAEESITLWRQLDDSRGLATALFHRGWPAIALGDFDVAKHLYEQGLQLLSSTDDEWLYAQFLFYLGTIAGFTNDFEQMRSFYGQSLALFEQIGDKSAIADLLGDKSAIADLLKDEGGMMTLEGKYTEAVTNLVKSIKMSYELGHKHYITSALGLLGFAVGLREQPDPHSASLRAAQLWGAADGRHHVTGFTPWSSNLSAAQEAIILIRNRVDTLSWKTAWKAGKAMNEEQVIALVCSL